MKEIVRIKFILLMILAILFLTRCEKESNLPTDGDGNVYDTVDIGTQVWLTDNLKPQNITIYFRKFNMEQVCTGILTY